MLTCIESDYQIYTITKYNVLSLFKITRLHGTVYGVKGLIKKEKNKELITKIIKV